MKQNKKREIFYAIDLLQDEEKRKIFERIPNKLPMAISANHKVLTINGWIEVKKLKSRDWLIT